MDFDDMERERGLEALLEPAKREHGRALCGADEPEQPAPGITLAEALALRADTQQNLRRLSARLSANAKVQEGEQPAEAPLALIAKVEANARALETLICRINKTNSETLANGVPLTALLAKRDALTLECSILRKFLEDASRPLERYSKTEIKILPSVNVEHIQKTADRLSKELRQLDNTIQRLNWTTTLL